jgi:hypothetical protein
MAMGETLLVMLRGGVLLAFLAVMPLLALPIVGQSYDAWLLGDVKSAATLPPEPEEVGVAHSQAMPAVETSAGGRFDAVSRRLQELGAESIRLEAADVRGEQYRFACRVPLPESAVYSRPFEALAGDPAAAMEQVLAEVEAWLAARDPASAIYANARLP